MLVDPVFTFNATLPDVPAQRRIEAYRLCGDRQYDRCNAPVRLEMDDGQKLWLWPKPTQYCYGQPSAWEREGLDETPALAVAWRRASIGEGAVAIDNQAAIRASVQRHNAAVTTQRNRIVPGPDGKPVTADGTPAPAERGSGVFGCAYGGAAGGGALMTILAALGVALMAARRRRSG